MEKPRTIQRSSSLPAWASLALVAGLLALSFVLMAGLVYAQTGSISGTVTYYGGVEPGTYQLYVDVLLDLEQPPVASTTLFASGVYTVSGLADDSYYVCCALDAGGGGGPYTCYDADGDSEPDPVLVSDGAAVAGIDVDLGGPWLLLGGPIAEGGQINALAVHPTISGTVYAAMAPLGAYDSGPSVIFRTTDGAVSWTSLYTIPQQVYALAVTGTQLYAGAFNPGGEGPSIYTSDDGGVSWTPVLSLTGRGVWLDISLHPTDTNVALIGGWLMDEAAGWDNGVVYGTDDGGLSWTPLLTVSVPDENSAIHAVLVHPFTPTLLFAAGHAGDSSDSVIYRSEDGGLSWPVTSTVPDAQILSLAVNTTQPNMLYAGAGFSPFTGGRAAVFRSNDTGQSWTEVSDSGTFLAFEPPSTVYTVMDTGEVWVSTSDGDPGTWNGIGGVWGPVLTFDVDLGPTPAALYAGTQEHGVYKGTYDGANWNWEQHNDNIELLLSPRDIDLDPQDPDRMFVTAECGGGWLTADGGTTWTEPSDLAGCMGAFAVSPDDPNIVYGGAYDCSRGAVLRSEDGGLNFEPVYTATFIISDCSAGDEQIVALAIAPSMTSTVYAAGSDQPDWGPSQAVALRSLNDGISWTEVFTMPPWSRIVALAIDPTDDDVVYAGGEDCTGPECLGFLYRTIDGGDTWQQTLVTSQTIASIAINPQNPDVLYVGDRDYRIQKSMDGGDTWFTVREPWWVSGLPSGYLVVVDPNVPSHVYLGGYGYMAETANGGQTWSEWDAPINQGTPNMEPGALVVDNGTLTQTLYASFSGVWAHSRPAPQPGEAMTITAWTDVVSAPVGSTVDVGALVVDRYENWVANGTEVTFTTSQEGAFDGNSSVIQTTATGQASATLTGVAAGTATITVTAGAADDMVAVEFVMAGYEVYLPLVLRNR